MSTTTSNLNENESKSTIFGPPQFFSWLFIIKLTDQ